jgi:hypothetical protein
MSETTTQTGVDYKPKGITQGGGDGTTDWAPLPPGNRYIFRVDDATVKDPTGPPRIGPDGKAQKQYQRVLFRLTLDEEQAAKLRAHTASKLKEGQEQSTSAWYSAPYTWGWVRDGQFNTTKLFDFCATVGGFSVASDLKAWLLAGGELDPRWFNGMVFRGAIEHQPRKEGTGVWVNVTPMPIDGEAEKNRQILYDRLRIADSELIEKIVADVATDDDLPF